MDYLFFVVNSFVFAITVLLLLWRLNYKATGLLLRHWILSTVTGIIFYLLNKNIFSLLAVMYLVINIAVPIAFVSVLIWLLWPLDLSEL